MEKFEVFKEITFTILDDNDNEHEIMFDILSNGKVMSIYCYKDGIPKYFNRRDDLVPIRTKPGKNPVFVHIVPNKNNISKLLSYGNHPFIETMDDYELLHKMLYYYDIKLDTTNWGDLVEESFSTDYINPIFNLLEEYLSVKFQRPIKKLKGIDPNVLLFHYDSKRMLKLEKNQNIQLQVALYNYLKNKKDLPIAKIYDVGTIELPKNVVKEIHPYWVDNRTYIYHIMEKVTITDELLEKLDGIDREVENINQYYETELIPIRSMVLYELSNYIQSGDLSAIYDIQNYFYNKKPELYDLLNTIIEIITKLGRNKIWWNDVHSDQFGYNHKGELVAFDLDGLDPIEDERLFLTKTNIRENIYIKTFESFNESMSVDEIINLIQDGKNIRVKYIYDYPEHETEKGYRPVDIDENGNITLDIDNNIYYTKLDWVEGIVEQNLKTYEVNPSMTDPLDSMERREGGEHWETDKEFRELLKDQGGLKGVIKKMKKVYDLNYSDCKNEEDLYQLLKSDNMI
jgi:hypothetical protein